MSTPPTIHDSDWKAAEEIANIDDICIAVPYGCAKAVKPEPIALTIARQSPTEGKT